PLAAASAPAGAGRVDARRRPALFRARVSASHPARAGWRASAAGLSLALLASALAWSGSAVSGAMPQRDRVAPWIVRVQRLVGDLPISVSVAEDGRLVDAHAGNVPRPPASDEKLLLSMALLDRLGARY